MDMPALLSLISTLAVVAGLVFAGLQVRGAQQQRSREASLVLARSTQSVEYMKALRLIMSLPDGVSMEDLADRLGEQQDLVWGWTNTMEVLGILVYRREVEMDLVDDFFSGHIATGWRKLSRALAQAREQTQRPTWGEWFEWLANRMEERESLHPPVPAYVAFRDWQALGGGTGPAAALRHRPRRAVGVSRNR
jgi:hypothetical protein